MKAYKPYDWVIETTHWITTQEALDVWWLTILKSSREYKFCLSSVLVPKLTNKHNACLYAEQFAWKGKKERRKTREILQVLVSCLGLFYLMEFQLSNAVSHHKPFVYWSARLLWVAHHRSLVSVTNVKHVFFQKIFPTANGSDWIWILEMRIFTHHTLHYFICWMSTIQSVNTPKSFS